MRFSTLFSYALLPKKQKHTRLIKKSFKLHIIASTLGILDNHAQDLWIIRFFILIKSAFYQILPNRRIGRPVLVIDGM